MTTTDVLAVVTAALLGLLLPIVVRPLLHRLGAFDVPNGRSSHDRPTLRGGGLAAALALVGGALILIGEPARDDVLIALVCGLLAGCTGLLDDIFGLSVPTRLSVLLALGGVAGAVLVARFSAAWWVAGLVAILFVAYVNVVNFMDGVNAMSCLHAMVVGVTFATAGWLAGKEWLTTAGLLIALSFITFLPWNLLGVGMFLGDVGSYLLGSVIALTAAMAVLEGVPWFAVLAPLSIYWLDTALTLVRRVCRRQRFWEAHREHLYQRLARAGWSHLAVAGHVCALSFVAGLMAVAAMASGVVALGVVAVVFPPVAYLAIGYFALRGKEAVA